MNSNWVYETLLPKLFSKQARSAAIIVGSFVGLRSSAEDDGFSKIHGVPRSTLESKFGIFKKLNFLWFISFPCTRNIFEVLDFHCGSCTAPSVTLSRLRKNLVLSAPGGQPQQDFSLLVALKKKKNT